MSIHSKYIRKPMIPTPLIEVDMDARRDVLGALFAAHDRAKEEQRIADQIAQRPFIPTRRAFTPLAHKSRKIRITDKRVNQIIQASQMSKPPTPIKPIERKPNPFLDKHKDDMEALFNQINRVIGPNPNQQNTSNE